MRSTNAASAAEELAKAGLITTAQEFEAEQIIAPWVAAMKLDFKSDMEFLQESMRHHVDSYMATVLVPNTMSTAANSGSGLGRMVKDSDIEAAAMSLTETILLELGRPYRVRLSSYFGDDAGIASYILERTHSTLMAAALGENTKFLAGRAVRRNTNRLTQTALEG